MFAKSSNSDSYDYFLKGEDGELHRVGWASADSIKFDELEHQVETIGLEDVGYEFKATVEVDPEWVKQMNEEIREDARKNIELLDKVVAGLCCCIFGEERNCNDCPYQDDHYSCRLHLFLTARNAIYQYKKVYEQMMPKDE